VRLASENQRRDRSGAHARLAGARPAQAKTRPRQRRSSRAQWRHG